MRCKKEGGLVDSKHSLALLSDWSDRIMEKAELDFGGERER